MRQYGVIIAARTNSKRLPGKALLPIENLPMITFLIRRIVRTKLAGKVIFATTCLPEDDELSNVVEKEGIPVFRGANEDVVGRYVAAADAYEIPYVVRVTGDCPFVDNETLDYCLDKCNRIHAFDLATTKKHFPVGIDYEIYNAAVIKKLHAGKLLDESHKEHLTKYFYDYPGLFAVEQIEPADRWKFKDATFTVDTQKDYDLARHLAEQFSSIHFSVTDLIKAASQIVASNGKYHG
jgi:spore coat polysaccharide biosynthesis protein SpsF